MPSPFDDIDAAMQATIDATFGEGVTIRPMLGDGNYSSTPDPNRPVAAGVRATVARSASIKPTDFNNSNRNGAAAVTTQPEIWIDRAAYLTLGYRITRGDRIELTDDGDPAPSFTVAAAVSGDNGDVQIMLAG